MYKLILKFTLLILLSKACLASVYMAKIEPYEKQEIKSEVSGKIIFLNKNKEYSYIKDAQVLIKIDDFDEQILLKNLNNRLTLQDEILKIRKQNYKSKSNIRQLSQYDKNMEKLNYLNVKQNIFNLNKEIKTLKNTIKKKNFFVKNSYLGKIYKNSNEYVQIGEKLFDRYDFSKSKIILYINENEIDDIKNKKIYINNQVSKYYLAKNSLIKDEKRVSRYKVILLKKNSEKNMLKRFGQIVQVEFKDD